jgi:hypothetical protein
MFYAVVELKLNNFETINFIMDAFYIQRWMKEQKAHNKKEYNKRMNDKLS